MNEIAAVLLYVMSAETDPETDAFWCFSEMMAESWLVFWGVAFGIGEDNNLGIEGLGSEIFLCKVGGLRDGLIGLWMRIFSEVGVAWHCK